VDRERFMKRATTVTLPPATLNATYDMAELLGALAARAGLFGAAVRGPDVSATVAAVAARLGVPFNRDIVFHDSAEGAGPTLLFAAESERRVRPPRHLTTEPEGFSPASHVIRGPEVRLSRIAGGHLIQFGNAPIVLMADRRTVLRDCSSRYAPLVHHLDIDLRRVLDDAIEIPGPLLVLGDEVRPTNYCHWLVDWLPRIAVLDGQVDRAALHVAIPLIDAFYQRELLALSGIDENRIVQLAPMQAVRAQEMFVTSDLPSPPHPAFKAAPWALRFLRRTLAPAASGDGPRRLDVSRDDATGRRVVNEANLLAHLTRAGFVRVTLDGLSVRAQATLFAGAAEIIAPHGAGLANLIFARPGARLLEVFPSSYGTAAYYVLAAAGGLDYASYVTRDIESGSRTQFDTMRVDIVDMLARWGGGAASGE
jgi:capsular polysaccharide biosynthesis protein